MSMVLVKIYADGTCRQMLWFVVECCIIVNVNNFYVVNCTYILLGQIVQAFVSFEFTVYKIVTSCDGVPLHVETLYCCVAWL